MSPSLQAFPTSSRTRLPLVFQTGAACLPRNQREAEGRGAAGRGWEACPASALPATPRLNPRCATHVKQANRARRSLSPLFCS